MFVLLLLAIAASSAAPAPMIVGQAVPLTLDEEAMRIVYNIIHNKAFVNLNMRAPQLDVLIVAWFNEEWANVQKAHAKAGRPSVSITKVKKPKTQPKPLSEASPCTPSLPLVSAPQTVM